MQDSEVVELANELMAQMESAQRSGGSVVQAQATVIARWVIDLRHEIAELSGQLEEAQETIRRLKR